MDARMTYAQGVNKRHSLQHMLQIDEEEMKELVVST